MEIIYRDKENCVVGERSEAMSEGYWLKLGVILLSYITATIGP